MFWDANGTPMTSEQFLNNLFGDIPKLFKSETELKKQWSKPDTRKKLLERLEEAGYGADELNGLRKLIDAQKSDLFDVLEYVFKSDIKPLTRAERVAASKMNMFSIMNDKQKEFIEFVLSKYIEAGVGELDETKLPILLSSKFQSQEDGIQKLGGDVMSIRNLFVEFQQYLYQTA
jgi:type I restriction enzyme R subunit